MYKVPTGVAVTMALTQGGTLFGSGAAPPGAIPIDQPVNRVPTAIAAGGSLTITLAAVPATQHQVITALAAAADDFSSLRLTTRINGVAVAPFILDVGTIGVLATPTPLGAPILCGPGDVFSMLLENIGAAPMNIAGRAIGWRA